MLKEWTLNSKHKKSNLIIILKETTSNKNGDII